MPTLVTNYAVVDGQSVSVDVLIGDLQPGSTSLFLGVANVLNKDGDVVDFVVGNGADLRGQSLVVSTVVLDRNPMTDFTSTVTILEGGAPAHVDIPQSDNPGQGGISSFATVVRFV